MYDARNCSYGGINIMNGSDVTPSNVVPFEYCATSTGLSAVISDAAVMSCSWNWPRLSVATAAPLIETCVLSV